MLTFCILLPMLAVSLGSLGMILSIARTRNREMRRAYLFGGAIYMVADFCLVYLLAYVNRGNP